MKKAYNKKAFTLAELSIVLVVLGIIIGMTLKGFGVLDAARLRNELGKINKFQTAYNLYFERTGHILPEDNASASSVRLDHTPLYDYGLLKADAEANSDYSDIKTVDPDNPDNNSSIYLVMCEKLETVGDPADPENTTVSSYNSVVYTKAALADGVCLVFNRYYPTFICGAEISYDDMRIYDGSGRYWGEDGTAIGAEVDNWTNNSTSQKYNCSRAAKGNTDYAWAYMIL
ncbi:MAG: type II secretion system GspH family protein [Deferribacteraceae bacterium]|jgi:prepilin-type N-terminal cleavage/methylation domain-containing protein|nr:type II secretion system GspH family protein [Deferribacteraceae bacterium]